MWNKRWSNLFIRSFSPGRGLSFSSLMLKIVCLLLLGSSVFCSNEALVNGEQHNCEWPIPESSHAAWLKSEQGTFGNLGMYAAGIPVGLFIDSRGPRPGVLFGAITMGIGYFALHRGTEHWKFDTKGKTKPWHKPTLAYETGAHSVQPVWLCFFATLTGIGGCASFAGSIKTCEILLILHHGNIVFTCP